MNIIFGLTLLTLAVASPTSILNNVHEYMTDEELENVFRTKRDNIPEYNVTLIHWPKLHKRSAGSITHLRLNVFRRDIDLLLTPTDGILAGFDTPVHLAFKEPGFYKFKRLNDAMTVVGKMLEDRKKGATFMVNKNEDDKYTLSGTIDSEGVNVKPLPNRLYKNYNRIKKSVEEPQYLKDAALGEYSEPLYHFIYKKPGIPDNAEYIGLNVEKNSSKINAPRSKRSIPEDIEQEDINYPKIIYPQILVLVDHAIFQLHGKNVESLLEYMLPFWNNVDLRFRLLTSPEVRLNIAGIVIANDSDVFSFFAGSNMIADMINMRSAIGSLSEYMYYVQDVFPLNSYDIAVAVSSLTMCSQDDNKNMSFLRGMAYLRGACLLDPQSKRSRSVAISRDRGAFDGVFPTAHEIGHLIGSNHDGTQKNVCPVDGGYIMTQIFLLNSNSTHWSNCSLNEFTEFIKQRNPTCLYDKPKTLVPMLRVLAGRVLTMDDQCERLAGTKSCTVEGTQCMRLRCLSKENQEQCLEPLFSAADGTICDTNKICFFGQCLSGAEIFGI